MALYTDITDSSDRVAGLNVIPVSTRDVCARWKRSRMFRRSRFPRAHERATAQLKSGVNTPLKMRQYQDKQSLHLRASSRKF